MNPADMDKARAEYEGARADAPDTEQIARKAAWFDRWALRLIEALEAHNEGAMERDEGD